MGARQVSGVSVAVGRWILGRDLGLGRVGDLGDRAVGVEHLQLVGVLVGVVALAAVDVLVDALGRVAELVLALGIGVPPQLDEVVDAAVVVAAPQLGAV